MGIILSISSFASRVERKIAAGESGIRRFAQTGTVTRQARSGGEETFWDGLSRFGASLFTAVTWKPPWLNFSITGLWQKAVATYQFIFNFNINATDKQLEDQIKAAEIALAGARGALKGTTLGYLVCGIAPTATIAVVNEPLALYLLAKVGEEAAEEIASKAAALINLQNQKNAQTAFYHFFKNNRAIIRNAILGSAKVLQFFRVPIDDEAIEKANKQRDQPWSLANAMDESIERIADPSQRAETEEFWEEFGEACIEAGYIVAGGLDSWILQQRVERGSDAPADEDVIIINPSGSLSSGTTP